MHDDADDTIPHAAKPSSARTVVDVDEVEVALGDTVVRESTPPVRRPVVPETPPLPAALRPHHRVRVGAADPIELDRPVHIGRRPRPVRVPVPAAPRLVTVASPDGGISSTHLELREQGSPSSRPICARSTAVRYACPVRPCAPCCAANRSS
ncbi:hypothetical protein [Homoserinibacter gongjuensis]|uniref:hypothetical protein n=1 Tax=Homoserinibacter gongjuensis TaxID=1162968 RepID=UPI0024E098A9|nr:hypothetical protein [Homoserinibacter gongjuensis]